MMTDLIRTATDLASHMAIQYMMPGDIAIDATCGNGNDTVKLASAMPEKLYAFDIQPAAIENTRNLLISCGFASLLQNDTIRLICDSHENLGSYVKERVGAVMFNLGYMPGQDKSVTTQSVSTLKALTSALELLRIGGIICITMYSGHTEGLKEKKDILEWASGLDNKIFHSSYVSMINQKNSPPEIVFITRKK